MYFAQEKTEKKMKMEIKGDSVFSAIESINMDPPNAATSVAPTLRTNIPGNVTKRSERGVKNEE